MIDVLRNLLTVVVRLNLETGKGLRITIGELGIIRQLFNFNL